MKIAKKRKTKNIKLHKPEVISNTVVIEKPAFRCCACGMPYRMQKANFPTSYSQLFKGNNYFLPICKSCFVNLYLSYLTKFEGNEYDAMKRLCLKFDLYFSDDLYGTLVSQPETSPQDRISVYISRMHLVQYRGKTFDDYLDETENNIIRSFDDLESKQEKLQDQDKVTSKTLKIWGFGFEPEEYIFLNNKFAEWKSRVVIDSLARETLIRDLCIIKLQQQKSLTTGDIELYNRLQKTYQETLSSARLKPIQQEEKDKSTEKPLGVMINMFENEKPIPVPSKEWEDVDGIIRLFTVYFLGHLCKMLGLKNKYSKLYEDEMDKYRVKLTEYKDLDDEEIFDFVIDKDKNTDFGDLI